jgi:Domain of unknown function (DUF4249)
VHVIIFDNMFACTTLLYIDLRMNQQQLLLILFSLSLILNACSNKLEYDVENTKKKIVLWGAFNSSEYPQVTLHASKPVFGVDTSSVFVQGAQVTLFEDNAYRCTFTELDSGRYRCSELLKANKAYRLEVSAPNFDTLRTISDKLPQPILIDSIKSSLFELGQGGHGIVQFYVRGGLKKQKVAGVRTRVDGVTLPNGGAIATAFSCNFIPIFYAFDYAFQDISCFDSLGFFEVYSPELTKAQHAVGSSYGFSVFSAQSQSLLEKMANTENLNTNPIGLNLFYEPVYFPEMVIGGYGGVLYYQSLDSLIKL